MELPPSYPRNGIALVRKGTPLYRETHIASERRRRKAMSDLFLALRSLLPACLYPKQDRCTIVSYVIDYVAHLQAELSELGKLRAQLKLEQPIRDHRSEPGVDLATKSLFTTASATTGDRSRQPLSVTVRYWGPMDMFITLSHPKLGGVWSRVLGLLEDEFALDVQSVTLSATSTLYLHSIYAKVIYAHQMLATEELQRAILDSLHVYFI